MCSLAGSIALASLTKDEILVVIAGDRRLRAVPGKGTEQTVRWKSAEDAEMHSRFFP